LICFQGEFVCTYCCVLNNEQSIKDLEFILSLRDKYNIDFVRFIVPRHYGRWTVTNRTILKLCETIIDDYAGIKTTNSLSRLYTVDMFNRMSE